VILFTIFRVIDTRGIPESTENVVEKWKDDIEVVFFTLLGVMNSMIFPKVIIYETIWE
jgi:hypothetical protein